MPSSRSRSSAVTPVRYPAPAEHGEEAGHRSSLVGGPFRRYPYLRPMTWGFVWAPRGSNCFAHTEVKLTAGEDSGGSVSRSVGIRRGVTYQVGEEEH